MTHVIAFRQSDDGKRGQNYRLDEVWVRCLPKLRFSGRRPFESVVPHGRDRRARQQRAASRPARPLRSISVFQLFICLSAFAFPLFPSNLTNNLGCAVSGQGAFAHCSGARLCEPQRVDGNGRSRLVPTLKWLATRCGWSGRTQNSPAIANSPEARASVLTIYTFGSFWPARLETRVFWFSVNVRFGIEKGFCMTAYFIDLASANGRAGASGHCPRTSLDSAGARVGDPQRVASGTEVGTNFRATRPSTRCGSQSRAPGQCAEAPTCEGGQIC